MSEYERRSFQKSLAKDVINLKKENAYLKDRNENLERALRLAKSEMIKWNEDRCDGDDYSTLMIFREDLRKAIKDCDTGEVSE